MQSFVVALLFLAARALESSLASLRRGRLSQA